MAIDRKVSFGIVLAIALAVAGLFLFAGSQHLPRRYRVDADTQRIVRDDFTVVPDFLTPKPILLTIDDGPGNTSVDLKMLAILNKHHARALWFVVCMNMDPAVSPAASEHRQVLAKIAAAGQVVGNHSYHHLHLRTLDLQASPLVAEEISGCSRMIESITGARPKFFRSPYGEVPPEHEAGVIRAERMQVVEWTSNTFDSLLQKFKTHPQTYLDYVNHNPAFDVAGKAERGDILLMHDYPNTALALDELLTRLEKKGFVFVAPD